MYWNKSNCTLTLLTLISNTFQVISLNRWSIVQVVGLLAEWRVLHYWMTARVAG